MERMLIPVVIVRNYSYMARLGDALTAKSLKMDLGTESPSNRRHLHS